MENSCLEQFISSLAQSLKPGYPELISKFNSSECRDEIDSLLNDRNDAQTASKGPLLRCLLLNFHRQSSLALQSKAALDKEVDSLKAQTACLLQEVQTANKKAMRYLADLHSAESDLCAHKEELLMLRSGCLSPPRSPSQCDSGYSDSHSSSSGRLTPSPVRGWEQFPAESPSQPLLRDRSSSNLTSLLSQIDNEETGSLSSRRYSAQCSFQPMTHDNLTRAHLSKGGTPQVCSAPAFPPEITVARDAPARTSQCPRFEVLEFLAKDIELFDPDSCDHNVENYVRALDQALIDLTHATQREKVKLVWKTSSKAVHRFIESQPPRVRDDYTELCHALIEEFSSTADEIGSIVAALQVKHTRHEDPRDFYKRLRHAYFQGKNAPGLEESSTFKSLFLQNLHPCVRTHVVLMTHQSDPSVQEIRRMTQVAWETVVTSKARGKTVEPSSSTTKASTRSASSKHHPHNRPKGGDKKPHRDTERNRHVRQLPRDRHSHSRSCRKPYSEIIAQQHDQQIDCSDDDRSISECSLNYDHVSDSNHASEYICASGYTERYSPEPQVHKLLRHHKFRVPFS